MPTTLYQQPLDTHLFDHLRYMKIGRTEEEHRLDVARIRMWLADTRRIVGLFPSFLQPWIKPIAGFYAMYMIVAAERKEKERLESERLIMFGQFMAGSNKVWVFRS
ncbi:hypothetical protein HYALB_00012110 [Hymenoscyphus albidus]|uniref:Uncharacterized protein n=1 Tax=Hymenoscyphus albidus TaxID=595503 RepID=A0A9N9Q4P5_9HELO|nr:hypothetical protein HYALB_00012110 [Hymenoscyphus albidus]